MTQLRTENERLRATIEELRGSLYRLDLHVAEQTRELTRLKDAHDFETQIARGLETSSKTAGGLLDCVCPRCHRPGVSLGKHLFCDEDSYSVDCRRCGLLHWNARTDECFAVSARCQQCGIEGPIVAAANSDLWQIAGCTCGRSFPRPRPLMGLA